MRGWGGWLAAAVIAAYAASLVAENRERDASRRADRQLDASAMDATERARRAQWLRVGRAREIAPGESVAEVIIIDPYVDELNTSCLLYRGPTGAAMACPEMMGDY